MKNLLAMALLISSFNLFAADRCDLKLEKSNVCANFTWVYGPLLDQYNSVKIEYTENSQVSSIKVIPWMVMHGHEHGSRPVVLTKTGDREYLVDKIFFMGGMQGEWYLKVQLLDSQNKLIEEARKLIEFN